MHRTSRVSFLMICTLFAAVAVGLSACSGTDAVDKQGYIKENNKIQEESQRVLGKLDPAEPKSLGDAAEELDRASDKLDDLDVPDDYTKEHEQMVDALREEADIIRELKTAVEKKDTTKVSELTTRMSEAQSDFTKAINAMNKDRA